MNDKDLIRAMRRMAVETDSLVCLKAVARLESLTEPQAVEFGRDAELKKLDLFAEATKGVPLNRVRELAKAEKDGRLVVLPVKIGDKVFHLFGGKIQDLLVSSVIYRDGGGDSFKILVECIPFHRIYWREHFGKTVFLTREEAEAALKKKENVK